MTLLANATIATGATSDMCSSSAVTGFERRSAARHQVIARFIARPSDSADAGEIRRFATNLQIFARLSHTRLYKTSSGQCSFGGSMDTSLNLTYELVSIGQNEHDECSFNRCVRALAKTIESAAVSQDDFAGTINGIVQAIRRSDSINFRYPGLAANNALQEVYRHIYLPGTRERTMVDISADDFLKVRFEDFYRWFKIQQTALRSGYIEPLSSFSSSSQTADISGSATHEIDVEELNIDHHGWGHRSIILLDHAFEREGIDGIENATLRTFCHPNGKSTEMKLEPWREMADRLSCHRDILGKDKWLGIFSKREPPATDADMMRYARAIAQLFESDDRPHVGLRIIVAKFLQQQ